MGQDDGCRRRCWWLFWVVRGSGLAGAWKVGINIWLILVGLQRTLSIFCISKGTVGSKGKLVPDKTLEIGWYQHLFGADGTQKYFSHGEFQRWTGPWQNLRNRWVSTSIWHWRDIISAERQNITSIMCIFVFQKKIDKFFDSGAKVDTGSRILGLTVLRIWGKCVWLGPCSFQSTCLGTKQRK